jgi:hypothetical protein
MLTLGGNLYICTQRPLMGVVNEKDPLRANK